MWRKIHERLFSTRDSVMSGDGATVSGILLTAHQYDQSPPADERAALARLRTILAGTRALDAVERVFTNIVK